MMLRLLAPAKLNLYLRVLGKRPDGYHELETIFERLDLADTLTFEPADALSLTCSDPTLSYGEDNLVLKAARLLQREAGVVRGARIHLEKRIPVAAGLGGGSSDAAAALDGLNRLWALNLPQQRLIELAAMLGSDVPFFIAPQPFAIGLGRGERCEPLPSPLRLAHVLVVPAERLSTAEVYAGAQFPLTPPRRSLSMVAHALRNGSLRELADGLWNDLEPEAIRRCPVIATIRTHLKDLGCLGVRMSGSGSGVFGLCADTAHAHEVAARIRAMAPRASHIDIAHTEFPSSRVVTSAVP